MVTDRHPNPAKAQALDELVELLGIELRPVNESQTRLARQAYKRYGKGRHPASLNFGDCFACALAKASGEKLLYKGQNFSRTDVA